MIGCSGPITALVAAGAGAVDVTRVWLGLVVWVVVIGAVAGGAGAAGAVLRA
ncbi:MAG TPA: hypothetical protein PLT68_03240 [Actinomycetota bacterium]|nr:hypothetical protein [Actinomycetota bacterium]